jgi:hypothetical protein
MLANALETVTVLAGAAISDVCDKGGYRISAFELPACDAGVVRVYFWGCSTRNGSYRRIKDEAGADIFIVVPAGANSNSSPDAVAPEIAAWRFLKLELCDAAGAAVNQAANRRINVVLVA